jgi:tyrosyl-tRNA synthetase
VLVTKADGTKFGKTESGTIWLDARKTSPYAFFQFWLNVADADVYRFLRFFTFLSLDEIRVIEAQDKSSSGRPQAQRILAERVTEIVHDRAALDAAIRITELLFAEGVSSLLEEDLEQLALDGMPTVQLGTGDLALLEGLVEAGLAKSKGEGKTFIADGAVKINGKRVDNVSHVLASADKLFGRFTVLKRGKKNYGLIKWC